MARLTGDAMTETAQEELSQIPLISRLAATINILTSPSPPTNTPERATEVAKERMISELVNAYSHWVSF